MAEPKREPLVQILAIKGRSAWRKWLEDYSNWRGKSSSETMTEAVEKQARDEGYGKPPPSRTGGE